ncbi:AmpG family muropeptide MFS transporter [Fulvivirga sp. M361]|nr:AmpG family muropeptide MFS transporter [Fulvivirga sp. M361]
MGLPFIAIAQASTLMFKNMGITDTKIAFWTSVIMMPWTLKPLWSPILEMFRTKKYFVVITQVITGVVFALIAFSLQLPDFFAYAIGLLAVVALSGSTHDIATDGLYMDVLNAQDQAKYIGWQGAAYNLAKILVGGAFIYIAGQLEDALGVTQAWTIVIGAFGVLMLSIGFYHGRMLPSGKTAEGVQTFREGVNTLLEVLKGFFNKKYAWVYIGFILLYRFAEGFAIKIVQLFFKAPLSEGGLGLTTSDIGLVYGVFGAAAFVIGSLLAGYVIAARGLKKTLFIMCCCLNLPFLGYAALAIFQPENIYLIGLAAVTDYFGYGFGFVGLILFMMQQVAPGKYKMAHYAFASGIMNLGFMLPAMISGYLSDWLGYKNFFIWVLIATLPSLLAAWFVPFAHPDNREIQKMKQLETKEI